LQKLRPLLLHRDSADLERIARQLGALSPANLFQLAPQIQRELKEVATAAPPRDFLICHRPPGAIFFQNVSSVLLIFGPGIGIGDEILCFGLPAALSRILPSADVSVISMYDGLWNRVIKVGKAQIYCDAAAFVSALRGTARSYDLVFMVDFESPGLVSAICREPAIDRYVELSLGLRSVLALDKRYRRLHKSPESNVTNFYHSHARLLSWIHPSAELPELGQAVTRNPGIKSQHDVLTILVSPFTSKEDPSERYWSELLTNVVPPDVIRGVRLIVDTGPNSHTESFANALVRSSSAQPNLNVRCEIARSVTGRLLPLHDMLEKVEQADAIITADSFLAHAAARFDCPAFVLAPRGLENWRVPSQRSFYFRAKDSAPKVATAIQVLLRESLLNGDSPNFRASAKPECQQLAISSALLRHAFSSFCPLSDLLRKWDECGARYRDVVADLQHWPPQFRALLSDHDYGKLWIARPKDRCEYFEDEDRAELREHLRQRFDEWENSNLSKYLRGGQAL
jgi:ADP-heptose:LPS heptosyltransferase